MALPQIETIPDFVLQDGRKNLSYSVIESIKILITRLYLVEGEDKAHALNNIGVLESYINNFSNSVEAYKQSLSYDFSDGVYSNYLQALEKAGQYKHAIREAISFLEKNPNNSRIFSIALTITQKYFLFDDLQGILRFSNYHPKLNDIIYKKDGLLQQFKTRLSNIENLKIDCEYLSLLINLAYVEAKKIQSGTININIQFNDIEQMTLIFTVHSASFDDIKLLNERFDDKIIQLIESNNITSDIYFDHLPKLAIGFVIGFNNLQAA